MDKTLIKILIVLAVVLVLCIIFFVSFYFTRFKTMNSIEKLTDYKDGYNLYAMTVEYDYDLQDVIDYDIKDTQGFLDAVRKESLPFIPVKINLPAYTCSAYCAKTNEGEFVMGRNYDFKLDTSCMLVRCNPKDGYRSIACMALNNLGADNANENLKTKMACLTAPFVCLDGVNEKGVSIAILTLDSDPTDQCTGKEKITCSLAVRLILDHAATTEEAVEMLKTYDMLAINGRDYHFFISDAFGDSRAVEYDCEDEKRTLIDTPIQAVTNFYAKYIDKAEPLQKNGIYGHGKERYNYMMEVIDACGGVLDNENCWAALKAASTEPNPESITSNTQWSIVFNNTNGTADIILRRHWGDIHPFSL